MNRHSAPGAGPAGPRGVDAAGAAFDPGGGGGGGGASGSGGGGGGGGGAGGGGKRTRILEAAIRIFAEKGFYNAKVSEIARVAGVADGTIYLYFRSKDDLLISIFEDRMEQVNDNARAAIAGSEPPLAKLRKLLRDHLSLVQAHPLLAEVLTVELRQSTKFLKEYRQSKFGEFLKLVAQPIEEGQRDGSIRADVEAPVVARALFGAVDELVLAWLLRPRPPSRGGRRAAVDLGVVADQLSTLFIEGLRAAPAMSPSPGPTGSEPTGPSSAPASSTPQHPAAAAKASAASTGNAGPPPGKRRAS